MGNTFREVKQADVASLAKETNKANTQKITEESPITGTSQSNRRRLSSAPCQKIKQSSGKLFRNIASAKPKYLYSNSEYSTENLVNANCCDKRSTIFDPISFHSVAGVSSDKSGFSSLKRNLEPICLKAVPPEDSCKNNVYDMHVNNKQNFSAKVSQCMFFPSLKTKDFIHGDSNIATEASSCLSSEESSNPSESSVFRENRLKCKKEKHSFTVKSGMYFPLHKSAQIEPEKNISPRYKQREYNTATSNYYNTTTECYKIPCTVVHCGTQTDISFLASRDTQILEPVPNRPVSNPWFMLHKATNTSNENCSLFETSNEYLNMKSVNFLHLKTRENEEVFSKGSSHNNLHKSSHNNTIDKCDQKMNQTCCGSGCFSRIFSCCF
ncbi:uncharacterized protein LOC126281627 [Schistocerca gregaria]|uniref:uncharacterized protein LOC126281627 n=1 Tax=Schistocerca gregaria TaxID=7010 RepID=UPI00211F08D3|nr:uncharacterized protein LOC126281627 [Schistocerca gregaria]